MQKMIIELIITYMGNVDFSVSAIIAQIGRYAITIRRIVINNDASIDLTSNLLLIAIR
jgi:hypothetical protein